MKVFQALARKLADSSVTPNMISCSSMLFGLLAGLAMAATMFTSGNGAICGLLWLVAAAMVQGRLIANLLDGMVAVEGGKATATGELYNEVPDRVSDTLIFAGAGFAVGTIWLGFSAAVVAVFVAYVRAIGASVGAGQVFAGPMAKPHRMALMTVVTLLLSGMSFFYSPFPAQKIVMDAALWVVVVFGLVTACRRLRKVGNSMRSNAK